MRAAQERVDARLVKAKQAAQMVLAKHLTVIPSADPQAYWKHRTEADAGPVEVGVRNISRMLAR